MVCANRVSISAFLLLVSSSGPLNIVYHPVNRQRTEEGLGPVITQVLKKQAADQKVHSQSRSSVPAALLPKTAHTLQLPVSCMDHVVTLPVYSLVSS